jgi:hypothetical protein
MEPTKSTDTPTAKSKVKTLKKAITKVKRNKDKPIRTYEAYGAVSQGNETRL